MKRMTRLQRLAIGPRGVLGWRHVLQTNMLLVLVAISFATASADEEPDDVARAARIQQRDASWQEALRLRDAGETSAAIGKAEQVLAIERDLFGDVHGEVVGTLELLAELHTVAENLAAAKDARAKVLAIVTNLHGDADWRVMDARWALKDVERFARLSADERRELERAAVLNGQVVQLLQQGRHAEAIEPATMAIELRKRLLGEAHPDYALSLNNLAALYRSMGNNARALPLFQQALEIQKKALGEAHPDYALSLNNLAWLYQSMGDHARALPLYQQALEIVKKALGEAHPVYATSLNNLAALYDSMGDHARALPLCQQALEIRKKALGEAHPDYAASLNNLAALYRSMGDHARALSLFQQALEIRKQALGEAHPDYAASLNNLAALYRSMGDYARALPLYQEASEIYKKARGEAHPDYATSLNNLAGLYKSMGDYARALPLFQQALEIRKKALGEAHPDYAQSLNNLSALYDSMGDHARALPLLQEALEITKKALGEAHPDYAMSLNNLALLYRSMGDHARALPLCQQALEITKKALGEAHPHYAASLNSLALLYYSMGDHARALPLCQQALEITKKALGEAHPVYATSLNNLAGLYKSMGDHARALPLYQQALEIKKQALGEAHPDYATSLNNLALLYQSMGDHARALPLYQQASEVLKKALGEAHPDYATSLNNLAGLYHLMEDHARALPFYQQASEVLKKALGEAHPDYATSLNNLAALYDSMGDHARALPLYQQALEIRRKALGEAHPDYAMSLNNLAALYNSMGDHARALPLYQQALPIAREHRENSALVQSERQQRAMLATTRPYLDNYLGFVQHARFVAAPVYREVLAWKGATLARQRAMRAVAGEPELAPLFAELQAVASRLSTLALATPKREQRAVWQRQLDELTREKERLEAELSNRSAAFRQARTEVTLEALQQSLPAEAALVDYLEYNDRDGRRLAAFVVRPTGDVTLHVLAKCDEVAGLVRLWRDGPQAAAEGGDEEGRESDLGRSAPARQAAADLKRLVWEPLASDLAGVKLVLVSPDGELASFPLAVLPGNKPDTYLIEDDTLRLAVITAPQLLPELLAAPAAAPPTSAANLLVVGGVDYDRRGTDADLAVSEAPIPQFGGRRDVRWEGRGKFERQQGMYDEMVSIEDTYKKIWRETGVTRLEGLAATEGRFIAEAPRHIHLHLATHGYFAPKELRQALRAKRPAGLVQLGTDELEYDAAGMSPGLLSGIALAGANLPPDEEQGDGILSAEEVATLDLSRCEVCVLSCCQTGLGETVGGEGLLGLQRAFQVAGARTTITSLWKVEDEPTRALMVRFYQNLWKENKGTLEALREAQLWMLKEGVVRGVVLVREKKSAPNSKPAPTPLVNRVSPKYWAAFVLAGDWR